MMVGLLDICDLHEIVTIRGQDIEVTGLSGESVLTIIRRFPEIEARFGSDGSSEVTGLRLMEMAPDVIAAVIAAGTKPGGKDAEKAAAKLTVGEQAILIEKVLSVTFPLGIQHVISMIYSLANAVQGQSANEPVPATTSLEPLTS